MRMISTSIVASLLCAVTARAAPLDCTSKVLSATELTKCFPGRFDPPPRQPLDSAPSPRFSRGQEPLVTLDPEPKIYAWWLRARFNPMHTEVRGIPVARIRKDWCKAMEFNWKLFEVLLIDESTRERVSARDYSYATFAVEGQFDGSKTTQVALVGVYETCGGVGGDFFLVIDKNSRKVRFLAAGPNEHPFAALVAQPDATVRILYCLECDHSDELRWDARKKAFGWPPERTLD